MTSAQGLVDPPAPARRWRRGCKSGSCSGRVAQQHLDVAQLGAGFEHVGRAGVAQRVAGAHRRGIRIGRVTRKRLLQGATTSYSEDGAPSLPGRSLQQRPANQGPSGPLWMFNPCRVQDSWPEAATGGDARPLSAATVGISQASVASVKAWFEPGHVLRFENCASRQVRAGSQRRAPCASCVVSFGGAPVSPLGMAFSSQASLRCQHIPAPTAMPGSPHYQSDTQYSPNQLCSISF